VSRTDAAQRWPSASDSVPCVRHDGDHVVDEQVHVTSVVGSRVHDESPVLAEECVRDLGRIALHPDLVAAGQNHCREHGPSVGTRGAEGPKGPSRCEEPVA